MNCEDCRYQKGNVKEHGKNMITDIRKNSYSRCADRQKYGQEQNDSEPAASSDTGTFKKSALLWPEYYY